MKWRWIGPIILAFGIISSAVVAKLALDSRWLLLTAPLIMAIALLAVAVIDHRLYGASRAKVWAALILGGAMVFAGVIVAQRDPDRVARILPIIGGVSAVLIGANLGQGRSKR